jgi:cytosine permease
LNVVEIGPVPPEARTQSALDLFLIFAGANIVATTLVTGAALANGLTRREGLLLIALGSAAGALLVAALAPLGPRLGVPSVVAARAALGHRGAALLAALLYVTNFGWIALNNVIAAAVCASLYGGPRSERAWAVGLGLAATAVVAAGPRAVGVANRLAVPAMLGVAGLLTVRLTGWLPESPSAGVPPGWAQGLDVVIGYQASWILMFADYSRYTRSAPRAAAAVWAALTGTSVWFMALGLLAARVAGSADPGAMLQAVGAGAGGALLLALGTLTTNFVNIYTSALAWKSLVPAAGERRAVASIGLVGAALSLASRAWLERYTAFLYVLGGLLVPIGGILLAHFFVLRPPQDVASLYRKDQRPAFPLAAAGAWALGAGAYVAGWSGGTLPSLLCAAAAYLLLKKATG